MTEKLPNEAVQASSKLDTDTQARTAAIQAQAEQFSIAKIDTATLNSLEQAGVIVKPIKDENSEYSVNIGIESDDLVMLYNGNSVKSIDLGKDNKSLKVWPNKNEWIISDVEGEGRIIVRKKYEASIPFHDGTLTFKARPERNGLTYGVEFSMPLGQYDWYKSYPRQTTGEDIKKLEEKFQKDEGRFLEEIKDKKKSD